MCEIKTKSDLREISVKCRKNLGEEKSAALSSMIQDRVLADEDFVKAETVLCYSAKNSIEVSADKIITEALNMGKTVALPRCNSDHTMSFYKISSLDDLDNLKVGHYGISEPDPDICKKIDRFGSKDICIVPSIAIDREGYRLGWGGGYYDRFLADFAGKKYGLCFGETVYNFMIPREKTDIHLDKAFTENDVFDFCSFLKNIKRGLLNER